MTYIVNPIDITPSGDCKCIIACNCNGYVACECKSGSKTQPCSIDCDSFCGGNCLGTNSNNSPKSFNF